ncbi:MAG: RagB/SusD family nutrient uptake outer membrane protein [Rikenellaceae bacterium]
MKNILYSLIIALFAMSITSCVDLDQLPQSFVTEEEYNEAAKNIEIAKLSATGLYKTFWYANYGFCCRMLRINTASDQMQTSFKANNSLTYIADLNPTVDANGSDVHNSWKGCWNTISAANTMIAGMPLPEVGEENVTTGGAYTTDEVAEFKAVLGEAYFMRALAYFYLVREFGDAPLILDPADSNADHDRIAVETIYNKAIVPDALMAVESLPETSRSGDSSTPSVWAAKALMADIYMTMAGWPLNKGTEYYALAAEQAKDVIEDSDLSLSATYEDLWLEAKKTEANEHMFAIHNSVANSMASQYGKSFYPSDYYPNAGWADYYARPDFMAEYPEGARKEHNFMTEWPTADGVITQWEDSAYGLPAISKYYDFDNGNPGASAQSNGLTPLYRYSEVLLMYAEASNLATGSVDALALSSIQAVQSRAGMDQSEWTTTTSSSEFDTAVFNETGYEIFAEGAKRWFDLVRRQKLEEYRPTEYATSIFKEYNHYLYPIETTQIALTGWSNNPGY